MPKLSEAKAKPKGNFDASQFADWGDLAELVANAAGNAPYLSRLIAREGEWVRARKDQEADAVLRDIEADIDQTSEAELAKTLRIAKGRAALYLALMDLGGALTVMEVTRYLTLFADFATETALRFLLQSEVARGKLPKEAASAECGLFALAMGKQGAYELNYSSDSDLILFYEETRFPDADPYLLRKGFIRVTQRLVKLLSEPTREGYVFRIDLRLRPDPSVTPVVIGCDQAESYYEALGRTWERAAFIKARPIAGDMAAGAAFLERLRPFIWRRYLDFAAIEDAHNMRLRIRQHKSLERPIEFSGHHLKLGRGGIREIEFFTQTRQLIFGGRDESLRVRGTLAGLDALAKRQIIDADLAEYLKGEYCFLRRLEHAAQMLDDQQTHLVPDGAQKQRAFLNLLGEGDDFPERFVKRVEKIDATMERFFAGTRPPEQVEDAAFDEDSDSIIEGWMSISALRSERSRALFAKLKPHIMNALAQAADPNDALKNFDRFLRGLPAGVQIFSLFSANPALLDLMAELCAMAPSEAKLLGQNARILEAVLSPEFFKPLDIGEAGRALLQKQLDYELKNASDYESKLDGVRRFVRESQFRVSVHLLRNLADSATIGAAYSMIADLALGALYPAVMAEMERRYGAPPGQGAAILAMGKLGSQDMTRSSDLDLVVIYDAKSTDLSEGARGMAASKYYARFTQNFIQALTVPTAEGALYEVDMRLRPSGRQGAVAVSLASFADYQLNEAWSWEHMALLRARVVAGSSKLFAPIEAAANTALKKPRDIAATKRDILEMRGKIRENFDSQNPFRLKYGAGRMMETELLLQGLALLGDAPRAGCQMDELLDMAKDRFSADEYETTSQALALYGGLMQLARLSFAGEMPEKLPNGFLLRQKPLTKVSSADELKKLLADTAAKMDDIFTKLMEQK